MGFNVLVFTRTSSHFDVKMKIDLGKQNDRIIRFNYTPEEEKKYLGERDFVEKSRDFLNPEFSNPPGVYFKAKAKLEKLFEVTAFDIVFSSTPDQWTVTLGSYFAKKYNTKFVIDFRDIYEQEEGMPRSIREKFQVQRFKFKRYLTSRNADLIVTVSDHLAQILKQKLKKKVVKIYNGYIENPLPKNGKINKQGIPVKIVYIGRLLNIWYRDPSVLFEAVNDLIEEQKISINDVSIDFYGTEESILSSLTKNLENKIINIHDRVDHTKIPDILNEADFLLLITNRGRKGILTTKLFEYMPLKKPILCVPGDGNELDELLENYDLGKSFSEKELLKEYLLNAIHKKKMGMEIKENNNNITFFTRENQSKILAQNLNALFD